jgi:hypothetical protein
MFVTFSEEEMPESALEHMRKTRSLFFEELGTVVTLKE